MASIWVWKWRNFHGLVVLGDGLDDGEGDGDVGT
jgi:hypothetical protein